MNFSTLCEVQPDRLALSGSPNVPKSEFFSESEKFCGEIAAAIDLPKRLKRNLPSPQPPSFPNLAPVSCLLIRVKAAPRYSGVSNV